MSHILIIIDKANGIKNKLDRIVAALASRHEYYHANFDELLSAESYETAFANASTVITEMGAGRALPTGLSLSGVADELEALPS